MLRLRLHSDKRHLRCLLLRRLGIIGGVIGISYFSVCQYTDYSTLGAIRLGRAAIAVSRVILDYKISLKDLKCDSEEYAAMRSTVHLRSAKLLRDVCCRNGGCFIKIGQHIGALEYLLPPEYVNTMKVLHSNAPQSSLKDMQRVICEDLGVSDIYEIFKSFSPVPVGTASLAQVYKAELLDGTPVAVKVQHPNVAAHSHIDLITIDAAGHIVAYLFPEFKFYWLIEEAKVNLPRELDFIAEGKNAEQTAKRFAHLPFIHVPKIYWTLSTKRVLTMEYCSGEGVDSCDRLQALGVEPLDVVDKLGRLYSEMIFEQGHVHCDPHPGNLLVQKGPDGEARIVLLDHGLYTQLSDDFRLAYCRLWQALLSANLQKIRSCAEYLNVGHLSGLFACMVSGRSWAAISKGIQQNKFSDDEGVKIQMNAARYLPEISEVLNSVPREMLLIFKTNDLLRGLEHRLGARARATAFISMTRCCINSLTNHRLRILANNHTRDPRIAVMMKRMLLICGLKYNLWRLRVYELFLWMKSCCFSSLLLWKRKVL